MPISSRTAEYLRDGGATDLDVRLRLADQCVARMREHPLRGPDGRAVLALAAEADDPGRSLCLRAVGAFLAGDLPAGTLRRLEGGKLTGEDVELLGQVLAPATPVQSIVDERRPAGRS